MCFYNHFYSKAFFSHAINFSQFEVLLSQTPWSAVHFHVELSPSLTTNMGVPKTPALHYLLALSLTRISYPEVRRDTSVVDDYFGTQVQILKFRFLSPFFGKFTHYLYAGARSIQMA